MPGLNAACVFYITQSGKEVVFPASEDLERDITDLCAPINIKCVLATSAWHLKTTAAPVHMNVQH